MVRKDKLKGYSVKQLTNIDIDTFSHLTRDELARIVTRLSSAANKRLRGLQKDDIPSPARNYAENSGGRFSSMRGGKKRTLNELRSEYARVSGFLKAKTSSRAGFKKVNREMEERLGMPRDTPIDEKRAFWKVYNELPEQPFFNLGSEASQKEVYNVFVEHYDSSKDYDDESYFINLLQNVKDTIQKRYEQAGMSDVSSDPSDYVML